MSLPEPDAAQADTSLHYELAGLLNRWSAENGSNTPDGTLASYLLDCLAAFDRAVNERSNWYGRHDSPGGVDSAEPAEVSA